MLHQAAHFDAIESLKLLVKNVSFNMRFQKRKVGKLNLVIREEMLKQKTITI